MEEWKTIEEYPEYEISTYGRVRSKDRDCIDSWNRHYYLKGKLIKLEYQTGKDNYTQIMVSIQKDKKKHRVIVARLVAKTFIDNPNNFSQINHKDENSLNNNVDNLEWCTAKYNINYKGCIKRRSKSKNRAIDVFESDILIETLESGIKTAKKYHISRGTLSEYLHGRIKGLYKNKYNFKFHS